MDIRIEKHLKLLNSNALQNGLDGIAVCINRQMNQHDASESFSIVFLALKNLF